MMPSRTLLHLFLATLILTQTAGTEAMRRATSNAGHTEQPVVDAMRRAAHRKAHTEQMRRTVQSMPLYPQVPADTTSSSIAHPTTPKAKPTGMVEQTPAPSPKSPPGCLLSPPHATVSSGQRPRFSTRAPMTLAELQALIAGPKAVNDDLFDALGQNQPLTVIANIIAQGADVCSLDGNGLTPLHLAVIADNPALIHLLVKHGALVNQPTCAFSGASTAGGLTPLHLAVRQDKFAAADALLHHGADVHSLSPNGNTPLHVAAFRNNLGMAQLLVAYGAQEAPNYCVDPFTPTTPLRTWSIPKKGVTPLGLAHRNRCTIMANFLKRPNRQQEALQSIANPLLRAMKNGATVGDVHRLLNTLSDEKRRAMVNSFDDTGQTPLQQAARTNNLPLMRTLINHGAQIDMHGYDGTTALHAAAHSNSLDTACELLNQKASANANDPDGNTPLHIAADRGYAAMAQLLHLGGAAPKRENRHKQTALALAQQRLQTALKRHDCKDQKRYEETARILGQMHQQPLAPFYLHQRTPRGNKSMISPPPSPTKRLKTPRGRQDIPACTEILLESVVPPQTEQPEKEGTIVVC